MSTIIEYELSPLPKTWVFDLDGTLVVHNGVYQGKDILLPGVKDFFSQINENDFVIIMTARPEQLKGPTTDFLKQEGIRYDLILFGLPTGERILLNDIKNSGLKTAYGVNLNRDEGLEKVRFVINTEL